LVGLAGPAFAAAAENAADISMFMPSSAGFAPSASEAVLSDKVDGGSTAGAHLVTVAATGYKAAEWFVCADASVGFTTGAEDPSTIDGCTTSPIATDTTAAQPKASSDNTFDAFWDIPQTVTEKLGGGSSSPNIDDSTQDIVTRACTNTGFTTGCHNEWADNVYVDDTSDDSGPNQTSAGEITSPANGALVSSAGFRATATTSDDVNQVEFCLADGDAGAELSGCITSTSAHQVGTFDSSTPAGTRQWHTDFTSGEVTGMADTDFAVVLNESQGGDDECLGNGQECQLDVHYVDSVPFANSAVINFPGFKADGVTPNDTNGKCANSTGTGGTSYTAKSGASFPVGGCLLQGSTSVTDSVDSAYTLAPQDPTTTGGVICFTGTIGGYGEGAEGPPTTPADQCQESVDGAPGNGSEAQNTIKLLKAGSYTAVVCQDLNNDGACGSGDTPSATGTITITTGTTAVNNQLHLASEVTSDPTCQTGSGATTAPAGSTVNLTGCPEDSGFNNMPNIPVIWFTPAGTPPNGFFTAQPNTSDASGHANASVSSTASQVGTSMAVRFCGDANHDGTCDGGFAQYQVNWTGGGGGQRAGTTLTLAKDRLRHRTRFFGSLNTGNANVCHVAGELIKLFRGSHLVDITSARAGGNYAFSRPNSAVIHTFHTSHPRSNDCGASKSPDRKARAK